MIKLKYFLATLVLIGLVACKNKTIDGYRISGKIEHLAAGTDVYLDEVAYDQAKPIDTAKVDKSGNYELTGKLTEEGLYRLRYGNNKYILLVLDPTTKEVELNADTANIFVKTYTVKGSPKSEAMRNLLTNINSRNGTLGQMMKAASDSTASDSVLQKRYEDYQAQALAARQYVIDYADTVNSPVLAIFAAANFLNPQTDLQEINTLSKKLATKYPNNGLVTAFNKSLRPRSDTGDVPQSEDPYAPKQLFATGTAFPDIDAPTPNGSSIKLSSLRGKYVLVDFWASWCKPCRIENPVVVNVYNKYKDKGFTIYSVSLDDDKGKWVNAIAQDKLSWINHVSQLQGWQSQVVAQFGVTSIPTNYLIDKDGVVVAFNLRGEQLEAALSQLIK